MCEGKECFYISEKEIDILEQCLLYKNVLFLYIPSIVGCRLFCWLLNFSIHPIGQPSVSQSFFYWSAVNLSKQGWQWVQLWFDCKHVSNNPWKFKLKKSMKLDGSPNLVLVWYAPSSQWKCADVFLFLLWHWPCLLICSM